MCYTTEMTKEPKPKPIRVAFIGTGVMGVPMAGHLLNAGHELMLFTRTRERAEGLMAKGATWADSPAAAAKGADVAISIVGYPDDVEQVHLGERGTLQTLAPGSVIVDMTTSRPSLATRIHTAAKKKGVGAIDAPVSGGDMGAQNATLSIMIGGHVADVERVMSLLEVMGTNIVHQGGPGAGQHTKMVNQILLASNMVGAAEAVVYAERAGLDPRKVIESVGAGAAGSWAINTLGPKMIARDFAPGFYVEHFIKDLGIALEEAEGMGLGLSGLELAKRLNGQLERAGHGRRGTQALVLALEDGGVS